MPLKPGIVRNAPGFTRGRAAELSNARRLCRHVLLQSAVDVLDCVAELFEKIRSGCVLRPASSVITLQASHVLQPGVEQSAFHPIAGEFQGDNV